MNNNTTIQKICCSFLICIFALSITPKVILHNLIANHRDNSSSIRDFKGQQVTKEDYNCHFENLVAESPFIVNIQPIAIQCPVVLNRLNHCYLPGVYYIHTFYSALRGPPDNF